MHIHRADYHKILVAEATRLGVPIHLDASVAQIDFEKPSVHLKDGKEFHADLILGADGLKSICREQLVGHPDPPHFTGDLAYRIIVKADDMKKHANLISLTEKPAINYWIGPNAHAVCYLLQGGGLYNIVLICPDNLPEMVNTAKADVQEMLDFFENWDPRLKTLLGIVKETSKWRLQNSKEMQSWSHPAGKFALLGDACHATLPYLYVNASNSFQSIKLTTISKSSRRRPSHRRRRRPRPSILQNRIKSPTPRHPNHLRKPPQRTHDASRARQHCASFYFPYARWRAAART